MRDVEIYHRLMSLEGRVANDVEVILTQAMLTRERTEAIEGLLFQGRWSLAKAVLAQILSPETVREWLDDRQNAIHLRNAEAIRDAKERSDKELAKPSNGVLHVL